ncbi:MAG TPA: hypothetical protein PLY04_18310 [bacterium]|jgi:hypothetical protein|nr:hypothetical protein [bacterium]
MRISRNFTVEDWKRLAFKSEEDWSRAVDMLRDRLETRYLEHIRELLPRKTSGFVVLALDCALIETLEQFKRGTRKTPQRQGQTYFISFLTSPGFALHFTETRAKIFYTQIRCGLLHQSEAEGVSRIKRGGSLPVVSDTEDQKSLVINKEAFHTLLERVVEEYYAQLKLPQNAELRAAFKRKMDAICRIEGSDPDGAA